MIAALWSFSGRTGLLACVIALIGAVAFYFLVLPRADLPTEISARCSRAARRIALGASWTLVPILTIRLATQVSDLQMQGDSWTSVALPLLTLTPWGRVWLLQIVVSIAVGILLTLSPQRVRFGWQAAAVGSLLLAATPAFSGHAVSNESLKIVLVPLDILHVLGAGSWIGTLLALLVAGIAPVKRSLAEDGTQHIARLVSSFSPLAQASVAVLVMSGVVAGWIHTGSLGALFLSSYGQLLLAKAAVVGLVAALGFINWKRNTPLIPVDGGHALTRSARREMVAATIVILITAVLIATPQPTMP